jgi:hypothetical protein
MKEAIFAEGSERIAGTARTDAVADTAAALIRERSAAGELVSEPEIALFLERHVATPDTSMAGDCVTALLARLILENEDLHTLSGAESRWYYSSRSMTGEYSRILLHAQEGPVRLIAETVRHNASVYRRPVPLDIFTEPPFNLAYQQVLDCLATMAEIEGYDDIGTTITSSSATYLYSTSHLEKEYAVMLAEWFDVGESENP